jgi:hypothetical protein
LSDPRTECILLVDTHPHGLIHIPDKRRNRPCGISTFRLRDYTGVTPCAAKLICESRVPILSDANTTNSFKKQVEQDGFAVVPACLDKTTVELLSEQFDDTRYPERNLLSVPSVRALATSRPVREIIETVLGPECFAVRGIFFNKTRSSNWKVVWHQDVTIAVRERADVAGFGPWTMKAGIFARTTSTRGYERPSRYQAACRRKRN